MSGLAGYTAVVRMTGTSTTFTGEAVTLVSGTTYQITNTAKRVWNPSVTIIAYDGVTPVAKSAINYLFGTVTLTAAPGGTVTFSGAYYPLYELAGAHEWSANMSRELLDTTPFLSTGNYHTRTHGLSSGSGDISVYDPGWTDINGTAIGAVTFTGTGSNDLTAGGTFTGYWTKTFTIRIDLESSPDTFKWSLNGGATWVATGVAITGTAQTLQDGITVTFGSLDTHILNDTWSFTVTPLSPYQVFTDGNEKLIDFKLGTSGTYLRVWAIIESINGMAAVEGLLESSFTWQSTSRGTGANFGIGS